MMLLSRVHMWFVIGALLMLANSTTFGQRVPNAHQYFTQRSLVNPAAMAERNGINGAFYHRSRWAGFADAGNSQFLDVNMPLHEYNSAVGITVESDRIGVNFNNTVHLNYAYKLQVDRTSFMSFGISPSFTFIGARYSEIQTDIENDPQFFGGNRQAVLPNIRFGAYYFKQNFYAGISVQQLLSPSIPQLSTGETVSANGGSIFEPKDMPIFFMTGIKRQLNANWGIEPHVMMRVQPNAPVQLDLNALFRYRHRLGVGAGYRSMKTFHFYANYLVSKDWKVGYSYGYTAGDIASVQSGNHEIMVQYGAVNYKRERVNLPRKIQRYRKKKERERKRKARRLKRDKDVKTESRDAIEESTPKEKKDKKEKVEKEKRSKTSDKAVKETPKKEKKGKSSTAKDKASDKVKTDEKSAKEKAKKEKESKKKERKKKEIKIDEEKPEKRRQPY